MRIPSWHVVPLMLCAAAVAACGGGGSGGGGSATPNPPFIPPPPPNLPPTVLISPIAATEVVGGTVAYRGTHRPSTGLPATGGDIFDWTMEPVGGARILVGPNVARFVGVVPGVYKVTASLKGVPQLFGTATLDLRVPMFAFGIDVATAGNNAQNVTGTVAISADRLFVAQNNDGIDNRITEYTIDPGTVQQSGGRRLIVHDLVGTQIDFVRDLAVDAGGSVYALIERMDTGVMPATHVSWEFIKVDQATFTKVTDLTLWNPQLPAGVTFTGAIATGAGDRIFAQTSDGMVMEFSTLGTLVGATALPPAAETLTLRAVDASGSFYFTGTTSVVRATVFGTSETFRPTPPLANIQDLAVAGNGVIYVAQQDTATTGSIHLLDSTGERVTDPGLGTGMRLQGYAAGMAATLPAAPTFTVVRALQRPQSLIVDGNRIVHVFDDLDHQNAIADIQVTAGGVGYLVAPSVTIVDGSGSGTGAVATATIDGNGTVVAIAVTSGGTGYQPAQTTVTLTAPPVGGTQATAAAFVDADTSAANIVRVDPKIQ